MSWIEIEYVMPLSGAWKWKKDRWFPLSMAATDAQRQKQIDVDCGQENTEVIFVADFDFSVLTETESSPLLVWQLIINGDRCLPLSL